MLPQLERPVPLLTGDVVLRMNEHGLAEAGRTPVPPVGQVRNSPNQGGNQDSLSFQDQLQQFYLDEGVVAVLDRGSDACLLYTSPSPRDGLLSRMPSSA